MKFIVDAQLPRRLAHVLTKAGHDVLRGAPPKLLLISTGNISNDALCSLIAANLSTLERALAMHNFVELNSSAVTIHV